MYSKTQFGWVITVAIIIGLAIVVFLALSATSEGGRFIGWIVLMVLLITYALFFRMTININEQEIEIIFGIGIIRKRFSLDAIKSCEAVKNSWIYGWGIHLTPHGWLYNVSGLDAVEIRMKNGKKARIGTAEPEALKSAIQSNLGSQIQGI